MRGLVLEGGGMRGMYTAGALDVLMENKITFDKTVGVSAGAVFGCSFHSGQYGRAIRYNKKYCRDKRYMSLRSLIFTGDLFGKDFCYRELPEKLDPFDNKSFLENPGEFYVVTTDINTGKPIYHLCTDCGEKDLEWMRASASMPFVSRIVKTDGYEMLDGGVSDSIPVEWMMNQGADKIFAILTRPCDYRKKENKLSAVFNNFYKKYPALVKAMNERYIEYNRTLDMIDKLEKEGKIFLLRPEKAMEISRAENNPDKLQMTYDLGREDMRRKLDDLKKYLEE